MGLAGSRARQHSGDRVVNHFAMTLEINDVNSTVVLLHYLARLTKLLTYRIYSPIKNDTFYKYSLTSDPWDGESRCVAHASGDMGA